MLDPRNDLKKLQHRPPVQKVEDVAYQPRQLLDRVEGQLALLAIVKRRPR